MKPSFATAGVLALLALFAIQVRRLMCQKRRRPPLKARARDQPRSGTAELASWAGPDALHVLCIFGCCRNTAAASAPAARCEETDAAGGAAASLLVLASADAACWAASAIIDSKHNPACGT